MVARVPGAFACGHTYRLVCYSGRNGGQRATRQRRMIMADERDAKRHGDAASARTSSVPSGVTTPNRPCLTCGQDDWRHVETVRQTLNGRPRGGYVIWACGTCDDGAITPFGS